MAAYRRVYDSRHLQAESQEPGSAPEPIRSVIEYGLTFFTHITPTQRRVCVNGPSTRRYTSLHVKNSFVFKSTKIIQIGNFIATFR